MSHVAVEVSHLWKKFHRGELHDSLRDLIPDLIKRAIGRAPKRSDLAEDDFWALHNVNFQVKPGETVGLIGANGAGKSTLFKVLARILKPNRGKVTVHGRLGALIEVAAGFHPDLTGRENIYLNGSILGMKQAEIEKRLDEIIAFSGIEAFIDTPVKRYSSGMFARLGFAVAAHLEPDVLLVNEVLAVGDAQFQKKCLTKMHDVAGQGRTILFVSHNMTAVTSLCSRAVWLAGGEVQNDGPASAVVSDYLKKTLLTIQTGQVWQDMASAPGNDQVRIHKVQVRRADAGNGHEMTVRTPLALEFEFWNLRPDARLNLSLNVFNEDSIPLFCTAPVRERAWHKKPFPVGLFRSVCYIPGDLLNNGTHRVQLLVVEDDSRIIFSDESILVFDVLDSQELRGSWYGKWDGALRPILDWSTEMVARELGQNGKSSAPHAAPARVDNPVVATQG